MEDKVNVIEQLRQLQVVMHRAAFRGSREHSSYRGRGRVLSILKENPTISRRELEERLDISRQALTELLNKLERSGCIVREPSSEDRRATVIRLTEQGREAARETGEKLSPVSGLLDCLTAEELEQFSGCLEKILRRGEHLYPEVCTHCTGPETCTHDYLKYGHDRPNPKYCKYVHLFPADGGHEEKGGDLA